MKSTIHAHEYFQHHVLPRRVFDKKLGKYRRILPHEKDRGESYPILRDITESFAHFGIGYGLYFKQVTWLVIVTILAGIILSPLLYQYHINDGNSATGQWPTAICSVIIVNATINCPDNAMSCEVTYRPNCPLTRAMIITDLTFCAFLLITAIIIYYYEKQVTKQLDEGVQTAQDYCIKVVDPTADASNPDEWYEYFKRFGQIRYITIFKRNRPLLLLLSKKLVLLKQFDTFKLQQQERHQNQSSHTSTSTTIWQRIGNLLCCCCHSDSSIGKVLSSVWTRIKQRCHLLLTSEDYEHVLAIIDKQLDIAYRTTYPVLHVYVVYEWEETQLLTLHTLATSGRVAMSDRVSSGRTLHAFRGTNILRIKHAPEPDTIHWMNMQLDKDTKRYCLMISNSVFIGTLIASSYIINAVKQHALNYVSLTITALDLFQSNLLVRTTHWLEFKHTESKLLQSLYEKLFISNLLITTLFAYALTPWDAFLDANNVKNIVFTQITTCILSSLIRGLDMTGYCYRIYGYLTTTTQDDYNNYWDGSVRNLSELYISISKVLFICIFYSFLSPASLYICTFSMLLEWCISRYNLLRVWKQGAMLDMSIARDLKKHLLFVVAAHMYSTCRFIYSWPLDQSIQHVTNTIVTYEYINKYPSLWLSNLSRQTWMSTTQQTFVRAYLGLTILIIIVTVLFGLLPFIITYIRTMFFTTVQSLGQPVHIPYSSVQGLQTYTPVITVRKRSYVTADTTGMRTQDQEALSRPDHDVYELINLIPIQYRKDILSTIRWYEDVDVEKSKGSVQDKLDQLLTPSNPDTTKSPTTATSSSVDTKKEEADSRDRDREMSLGKTSPQKEPHTAITSSSQETSMESTPTPVATHNTTDKLVSTAPIASQLSSTATITSSDNSLLPPNSSGNAGALYSTAPAAGLRSYRQTLPSVSSSSSNPPNSPNSSNSGSKSPTEKSRLKRKPGAYDSNNTTTAIATTTGGGSRSDLNKTMPNPTTTMSRDDSASNASMNSRKSKTMNISRSSVIPSS